MLNLCHGSSSLGRHNLVALQRPLREEVKMTAQHAPHTNVEKGSLAAQDSPWVVGSRAISHVRGRVHYQPSPVHVGRVEVGGNDTTLALRHCAARVWTGRWGCGSDRGDTAA